MSASKYVEIGGDAIVGNTKNTERRDAKVHEAKRKKENMTLESVRGNCQSATQSTMDNGQWTMADRSR